VKIKKCKTLVNIITIGKNTQTNMKSTSVKESPSIEILPWSKEIHETKNSSGFESISDYDQLPNHNDRMSQDFCKSSFIVMVDNTCKVNPYQSPSSSVLIATKSK